MPAFNTQQNLLDYIRQLEARIALLERSAVRIDKIELRPAVPAEKGRIIYDISANNRLYAGDGTNWNALW